MGMMQLERNSTGNALEALVTRLQSGGLPALGVGWRAWFDNALLQLEYDDRIEPRQADALADTLEEAIEAITARHNSEGCLHRLVGLYCRNLESTPLEKRWRDCADSLGAAQLNTGTWEELHQALDAAAAGRTSLALQWIEAVEEDFWGAWTNYEEISILPSEITQESALGHQYLRAGIEGWLAALEIFRTKLGNLDRQAVLKEAETGQRFLIALQLMEEQTKSSVDRFASAWAN